MQDNSNVMKILAVDDEPTNLMILQEIFDDEKFNCEVASSGEEGLEMLKQFTPDVILLDIMMPNIDGYAFCQQVKQQPHLEYCKVILVSGKAMPEERIKGYGCGADDYVIKPFVNEELEAKVIVFAKLSKLENTLTNDNETLNNQIEINIKQLMKSEKMASLGQLAAGVAHEINNPIGFVTSNLGSLKDYVKVYDQLLELYQEFEQSSDKKVLEKIQLIKQDEDIQFIQEDINELITQSVDGMQRVKEIVQGLKSFARVDESELKEEDINRLIEQALKLVWNEIKYTCEIVKNFHELPMVKCYPNQLTQVFMNMFVNASHAIEKQGIITIETFYKDNTIFIKISDNGSGIEKENIEKLFAPFFTTKPIGTGTGLGLAISFGIVEKHKGNISVTSEVGKGTTFTIELPTNVEIETEQKE